MAHFALGTGAPIVPAVILDGNGGFKRRLIIYPPSPTNSPATRKTISPPSCTK